MKLAGRQWLLLLILFALFLRVVFCGYVVGWQRAPIGDEIDHHHVAANLADGKGFALANGQATARRSPLYPFVLAGLYRIAGPEMVWGRVLQVLLGGCVVWLVFLVAARYFSRRTAWLAAALGALNPFLIFCDLVCLNAGFNHVLSLDRLLVEPGPLSIPDKPPVIPNGNKMPFGIRLHLNKPI